MGGQFYWLTTVLSVLISIIAKFVVACCSLMSANDAHYFVFILLPQINITIMGILIRPQLLTSDCYQMLVCIHDLLHFGRLHRFREHFFVHMSRLWDSLICVLLCQREGKCSIYLV